MHHLIQKHGLEAQIQIDSAGTSAGHAGEPADPRSRATATARGIELTSISRQIRGEDLERFDYVIAMDRSNARNLHKLASNQEQRDRIHLLRSFDPYAGELLDVPDPYYNDSFDEVFDICEAGCLGLLDHINQRHKLGLPKLSPE